MRSGLLRVVAFTFWFSTILLAMDDSPHDQQNPIMLKADSSKVLPIPAFSFETGPQCDSNGDLYFNIGSTAKTQAVLKLTTRDGSATIFRPRDEAGAETTLLAFYVTVDFQVASLVSGDKDVPYVYLFNEKDWASTSRTKLDVPEGVNVWTLQNFLLLPNGNILLQGYFDDKAPKDKRGQSFVATFNAYGTLVKLSIGKTADDVSKSAVGRGAKTEAARTKDGITYLLYPDKVAVISSTGDVSRFIKLSPPEPGYIPDQLYMNRGRLVVGYYLSDSSGKITKTFYQLLNPSTGQLVRLYQADPDLGSNLVCFSDDGFTFMKPEKGHVKLLNAPIK